MKKTLIMTLAAATISLSAMAQTAQDVDVKFNEAAKFVEDKDFQGAIGALESTIDMALDAGEDAVATLQQAQGLLPKIYFQLGVSQVRDKNFEGAVKTLLRTEELADLGGDVTTMRQASRLISNAYMAMGIDSFNKKEYAKALEVFSLGYKQDAQNITLAVYTAKSYAELDSMDQAAQIYRSVIDAAAVNPKFAPDAATATEDLKTYMLVAASKAAQTSDLESVIRFCDELLYVLPEEPVANLMVVQLANNLKKYDIVIERGSKAAEVQTNEAQKSSAYLMLGVAYQNKGNKAKALENLRKVTGEKAAEAKIIIDELNKAE